MRSRTLPNPILIGILTAVLIGFAVHTPADAAAHVTYSPLVPASQANAVDTMPSVGTCSIPDSNARITEAYPAQWLKLIAGQTNHATAQVLIDLDSVGNVMQAKIANSSGNTFLDEQALVAARGSKYAPEVRSCNSFKRSYFLTITFDLPTAFIFQPGGGSGRRPVQ